LIKPASLEKCMCEFSLDKLSCFLFAPANLPRD